MSLTKKELGVVQAVMEQYEKDQLPRLLQLKKAVDDGATLTDRDITFLTELIELAKGGPAFAEKHPEFQMLISRAVSLYNHITTKALDNEKHN